MTSSDDCMILLHADDGEQWANFITGRLSAPLYNIRCLLRNIYTTTPSSGAELYPSNLHGSTDSLNSNSSPSRNSSSKPSQEVVGHRDSGVGSRTTISELSTLSECITNTRASIVFLSPDIMTSSPFPFDVGMLNPKRAVFLFLGVDIEEVRAYFGEKSDLVFKCRCCVIDTDEHSVCDALVQIIEAYEDLGEGSSDDDDDIYNVPGCPRQLNKIEKVFPKELSEKERDVYVLLERPAEEGLVAVLVSDKSQVIPLVCVYGRMYMLTVPSNISGKICFKIECQNHCIGEEFVNSISKLDRLKLILDQEMDPLSVLASGLGLPSDDVGGVDTALAFKLQQLAPTFTFQKLFPCKDSLSSCAKDERTNIAYPSLLHFAADLNLRTLCSELLRYPGMLASALTENKDGEYPSQIAARKGYIQLESDLLQFVEEHKPDNELYVPPSPRDPTVSGSPQPHRPGKKSPGYVNEMKVSPVSGLYIDMGSIKSAQSDYLEKSCQQSDQDVMSPTSESSDNVFMPNSISSADGDDNTGDEYHGKECLRQSLSHDPTESTSIKALKMLGVREEDISRSRASTIGGASIRSDSPVDGLNIDITPQKASASDPAVVPLRGYCDESSLYGNYQSYSKMKTFNKIVSFFGKIKSKKSSSEGENFYGSSRNLKKSLSDRSDKSNKSSRGTDSSSRKKKSSSKDTQERDSGSYSDEDKGKDSRNASRKGSKDTEFKERNRPMTRRLSQRAHAASREFVHDAPKIPITINKKESSAGVDEDERF